ncbi:MAG: RluA family pseudouridine synthase [Candidatus Omnitrophica bacterium]|nr:RluA family pseudouridine synthase [Candidatus Omnitrophota bacterium]
MSSNSFQVTEEDHGQRLDVFLARNLSETISRTKIKECIKSGGVKVNGDQIVSAHHILKTGDSVTIMYKKPRPLKLVAQDLPLDVVYEDARLVIVNKPAGMVVHPGAGTKKDTLANALIAHIALLSKQGGAIRPGIVHRIDKDTSGLLVIAKSDQTHMRLAAQFKDHSITRRYYAVVKGVVQHDEGVCDASIGAGKIFKKKMVVEAADGRRAVTYFKVIERFAKATLLDIRLETGRTHQIRVHMAHLGHPVLGDRVYGVQSQLIERQALHAYLLGFIHPVTEQYVEFKADLPEDMQALLESLRAES